jgi:protein-S-isoprenylcysteine O-methyltransferase Ste14
MILGATCVLQAYDRIIRPEVLVTTGPYRLVQHPVYLSYLMLFVGFCLALHAVPMAMLAFSVCIAYYGQRVRIEEQLLRDAFGEVYAEYQGRTARFLPLVF